MGGRALHLVGIQHVRFTVAVGGSSGARLEKDTRVLALQSFLETYSELVL